MTTTTIQFDDDHIRPVPSRQVDASGVDLDHGVVFSRTVSMGRRSLRARSTDRASKKLHDDDDDIEDGGLHREGDYKTKQVFHGKQLFLLAYQSLGVIYGDIGTSPLYTFSSTFGSTEPSKADLVGVLSLIIWSLTIMVTLKYVIIILHADNEGEGGTFSTYSLLSRYANIANRDPHKESGVRMQRYDTGAVPPTTRRLRDTIENSKFLKGLMKTIGVMAVSMVMADGVLTPAQSVLGAVQGLNVVAPSISQPVVVGTTCGILILLFLLQPFGTSKLAVTFAPIVIIWLAFNATFGIYNLALFDYTVLKAFNPGEAFMYLIRNKQSGWRSLGSVLLCFTGVEALFADLGAFSMRAIQISWLCYTYPCLLLAYIGQAAYISVHKGAYSNPFYNCVPPGMLIPGLIFAILAAIVASQAIITATFQLMAQIIKLSYFPQITVKHTSKSYHGQLYVPLANWLLMIGTVLVAGIYNNTNSLGNAYGVCVMFVTFFDTCMVTLVALLVWRLPWWGVLAPWLIIACVDGAYLSSVLTKVPDGAWFTLALSAILTACFILWRFGKEQQWKAEASDRFPTDHFVKQDDDGAYRLTDRYGGESLSVTKGFGIFFDKGGFNTPTVFSQYIGKLVNTPQVMVFFHMKALETPTIPAEERYYVSRLPLPNCYRIILRHGYMDEVITPDLAVTIYRQVRNYLLNRNSRKASHITPAVRTTAEAAPENGSVELNNLDQKVKLTPSTNDTELGQPQSDELPPLNLLQLEQAFEHRVLYIVGKEEMRVKEGTNLWRAFLLNIFLFFRDNTRNKMANHHLPTDRLVEIGFVKDV